MEKTDKITKREQVCSRDTGILSATYCGLSVVGRITPPPNVHVLIPRAYVHMLHGMGELRLQKEPQ